MTGVACGTRVLIPGNLIVIIVYLRLIAVLMTSDTTEKGVVIWSSMTLYTVVPFSIVITTVNREILLIVVPV